MERNALFLLQNNESIIIKPSDKNLGLLIMDLALYKDEFFNQLKDNTTYKYIAIWNRSKEVLSQNQNTHQTYSGKI